MTLEPSLKAHRRMQTMMPKRIIKGKALADALALWVKEREREKGA